MGKFDAVENKRNATKSTAKAMTQKPKAAKRLVSFQTPVETYEKFSAINGKRGISNSTAINLMISEYVDKYIDSI